MKQQHLRIILALAVVIILGVLPNFLSSYYVGLMVLMLVFAIFAMSLDIMGGYGGMPSLGHAACFGVAAYVAGYLTLKLVNNFWLALVVGLLVAAIIAALFGLLVLRTRGVYSLMITLALCQVLWGIAFKWTAVTRGDDGLSGIPRPDLAFIPLDLSGPLAYYFFTLVIFAIAAAAMFRIVQSPFGLALKGVRDSETRMRALGYNVWLYRYTAFVIAGFFAGLAGVLSVFYHGFVGPGDLHIAMSAEVLLMVILGGAGTLIGPIIGAFGIVLLENIVSGFTARWLIALGAVYVLVILFAPHGIYKPIKRRVLGWLTP